jgi:uncharacterized protein YndB with AHSA1/START domain
MKNTGTLKLTMPTDREIAMTRVFDAPRALVFEAWTKPELLKRWLYGPEEYPLVVCEIDLRVGGALRFVWRSRDEKDAGMGMSGVYREIAPPDRLVFTEVWDQDWTGGEALVTIIFTEHAGQDHADADSALFVSSRARRRLENGHGAWRSCGLR